MDLDLFLAQLYAFVNEWGDYLKKEDKEIILNFILPKYQENKYALKIYSILAKYFFAKHPNGCFYHF
jgi:hypothetical protein